MSPRIAALRVLPFDGERESLVDDLVGLARGVIAARRDEAYGSLQITEEQERELANGLVANLLAVFDVRRLP